MNSEFYNDLRDAMIARAVADTKDFDPYAKQEAFERELKAALLNHTPDGLEVMLRYIRVIPYDSHERNADALASIITDDLSERY